MDRAALVRRNRKLAQAIHRTTLKQRFRRALLVDLGRLPIPRSRQANPNRILLIRPDALGDVLLTTPAIHALREALPNAELHALAGPWSAAALAAYDEIDAVLTLPFPGFGRALASRTSPYRLLLSSARHLRQIGYGAAIIFRPDHWWGALLARLAGIPMRVGYRLPDTKPFLTHGLEYVYAHAVTLSLRLVERWTGPVPPERVVYRFPVTDQDRADADALLERSGLSRNDACVVIHPGAGFRVKQWEPERWARVGDALAGQLDGAVLLTGTDREEGLAQQIAAQMTAPCRVLAGNTPIGTLAALYERARLVLGPDSGPLHLAAAVNTPTVTLFGPADPVEFGPWGPRSRHTVLSAPIGCRPCRVLTWESFDDLANHPCVRDITVAQVLDAARRALQPAP